MKETVKKVTIFQIIFLLAEQKLLHLSMNMFKKHFKIKFEIKILLLSHLSVQF